MQYLTDFYKKFESWETERSAVSDMDNVMTLTCADQKELIAQLRELKRTHPYRLGHILHMMVIETQDEVKNKKVQNL